MFEMCARIELDHEKAGVPVSRLSVGAPIQIGLHDIDEQGLEHLLGLLRVLLEGAIKEVDLFFSKKKNM